MRALLALALLTACGVALSQPPSPGGRKHVKEVQPRPSGPASQSATEPRGTASAPLFVQGLPAAQSASDAAHKEYEHHEKPALDRRLTGATELLALFTFLLFCFTAALWWVTYRLSRDAKTSGDRQAKLTRVSLRIALRANRHAKETSDRQASDTQNALRIANDTAWSAQESAAAAKRTADTLQRSSERQLRAYVSCQPNHISNFTTETYVIIRSTIRNHGQTPAYNERCVFVAIKLWPYPLPTDWAFPSEPSESAAARHDIFPNDPNPVVVVATARERFTAEEIDEIRSGNGRRIYIYGLLKYRDVFEQDRWTEFCRCVIPGDGLRAVLDGATVPSGGIDFEVTEQHNKST